MHKTLAIILTLGSLATANTIGYNSMTTEQQSGVVLAWDFSSGNASSIVGWSSTPFDMNSSGTAGDISTGTRPWTDRLLTDCPTGDFTLNLDIHSFTGNNWQAMIALYSPNGKGDNKCLQVGVNTSGDLMVFNEVAKNTGFGSIDTTGDIDTGLDSGMNTTATLTLVSDMSLTQTLSVYVNGILKGSYSNWVAASEEDKGLMGVQFGCPFGGGRQFPAAELSNITLWNRALSTGEISALIVPEPASATLSMLALTGLAARRRRK